LSASRQNENSEGFRGNCLAGWFGDKVWKMRWRYFVYSHG